MQSFHTSFSQNLRCISFLYTNLSVTSKTLILIITISCILPLQHSSTVVCDRGSVFLHRNVMYCIFCFNRNITPVIQRWVWYNSHTTCHMISCFVSFRSKTQQWYKRTETSELWISTHRHTPSSSHSPVYSGNVTYQRVFYLYMYMQEHIYVHKLMHPHTCMCESMWVYIPSVV